MKGSKVLLKGMEYPELEKWVLSHGYRPAQAMMLWKRLYGNNLWVHNCEELEGLNKDFKRMLSEHADFKTLHLKDILTASDGTNKKMIVASENCTSKSFKEKLFLYVIVANGRNGIDVDKFDYIVREFRACGLGCNFQFQRVLETMLVIDDEICYRAKECQYLFYFRVKGTINRYCKRLLWTLSDGELTK